MGQADEGEGINQETVKRLERASKYTGPHEWVQVDEFLRRKQEAQGEARNFMTGWPQFDHFTDGLASSEFSVISGMEGKGKSLFCRSLINRLLISDIGVGYISYEGNQYSTFKPFEGKNFKLYTPDTLESSNPEWVIEQCYRIKANFDVQFIVLDHLHYIVDMNMRQNLSLNIGALIRNLIGEVCRKLGVHVILVAHQQGIDDKKQEPGIETVRDSSFIRQEPDNFFIVHRVPDPKPDGHKDAENTYNQGWAFVKIDKSRRKGTYRQKITFQKKDDWLEEF